MAAITLAAVCSSSAFGGTIEFTPDTVKYNAGDVVTLDLSIGSSLLTTFDSVDIIVGSDDLTITDFEFGAFTRFFESSAPDTSVYPSGWKFGFFGPASFSEEFHLGTLTVVDPRLFGTYTVLVDAARDGGRSTVAGSGFTDGLTGVATVYAGVPEPATLSLLAIGCLAVALRSGRCHPAGEHR
jgi:hypothetical protein